MQVIASCYEWDTCEVEDKFEIWAWGFNRESENVFIRFRNVPVFAHIELPPFVDGKLIAWGVCLHLVEEHIMNVLRQCRPSRMVHVAKTKMYYRRNRKYEMLLACFSHQNHLYRAREVLEKPAHIPGIGMVVFKVHDVGIKAHRKLLSLKNVRYSQWFQVDATEVDKDERISTFGDKQHEYIVEKWNTLTAIVGKETEWIIYPTILSFDLEAYSPIHRIFPRGQYAGNYIYLATCIFQKAGLKETRKRIAILFGNADELPDVELIKKEKEIDLLMSFGEVIRKYDPDIITGYNIMGFDYSYINDRLNHYFIEWPNISRIKDAKVTLYSKPLNSDALGKNRLVWPLMPGRISIDVFKIVKREYSSKFVKFDLGSVSKFFLGRGKHDVPAQEQFRIFGNWLAARTSEDTKKELTKVLAYGVEDSELVMDLFDQLNLWNTLMVMSSIAGLPVSQLYTSGQQARGISLIFDKAHQMDIVMDNQPANMTLRYEGAFVANPVRGLHDNIICMDFASLYPSIIMAYNIDFTTFIPPEDRVTPDEECYVIEWTETVNDDDDGDELELGDIFDALEEPKKKKKAVVGPPQTYRFRFYKAPQGTDPNDYKKYWGIVPQLVDELVSERKRIRNDVIPKVSDKVALSILDAMQNGLKITANSLYGLFGVREGGMIPLIEAAMCVTAVGRRSIQKVNNYIREKYNGEIVYGDSVVPETPILVRMKDGSVYYRRIDDISDFNNCVKDGEKERISELDDIEVWSDLGWTKIKQIIRHKTSKRIYRVLTHTGSIDVTEDHSLIKDNGQIIAPKDLKVNDVLLHQDLPTCIDPKWKEKYPTLGESAAAALGLFYAEGSCGVYDCPSGAKASWAINNQDHELLNYAAKALYKFESTCDFVIDPCMESSGVDKLTIRSKDVKSIVRKYREWFYDKDRQKKVPDFILSAPNNIKGAFLQGYYAGDGDKYGVDDGNRRYDNKGQIGSAGLIYLCHCMGYSISINTRTDKKDIFRMTLTTKKQRKNPNVVKKIIDLGIREDYVYDLETENHHFAAGPGRLIVHNTDSSFINLHITDIKEVNTRGTALAKEITALFPPPMSITFEKGTRVWLLKKKFYAYWLIKKDGTFEKDSKGENKLYTKGIVLARRDNFKWLQNTYRPILINILSGGTLPSSLNILMSAVHKLVTGQIPIEDFIIVKSLGSHYKNPNYAMKLFADELAKSGRPAQAGERIDFIVYEKPGEKYLGKRMCPPQEIIGNEEGEKKKVDYVYYLHLATKSLQKLIVVGHMNEMRSIPKHVGYKPPGRFHFIPIRKIMRLIQRLVIDGYDPRVIFDLLNYNDVPKPQLNIVLDNPSGVIKLLIKRPILM